MPLEANLFASVQGWLGPELEARGIDALIYSRYILSILLQDGFESDLSEEFCICPTKPRMNRKKSFNPLKVRRKKLLEHDSEKLKKSAVVDCLLSITEENSGIEDLVDELYHKLQEQRSSSGYSSDGPSQDETSLICDNDATTLLSDPAERYYAAFPALNNKCEELQKQRRQHVGSKNWAKAAQKSLYLNQECPYDRKVKNQIFKVPAISISGEERRDYRPRKKHRRKNHELYVTSPKLYMPKLGFSKRKTWHKTNDQHVRSTSLTDDNNFHYGNLSKHSGSKHFECLKNVSSDIPDYTVLPEVVLENNSLYIKRQKNITSTCTHMRKPVRIECTLSKEEVHARAEVVLSAMRKREFIRARIHTTASLTPKTKENAYWYTRPFEFMLPSRRDRSRERLYQRFKSEDTAEMPTSTQHESVDVDCATQYNRNETSLPYTQSNVSLPFCSNCDQIPSCSFKDYGKVDVNQVRNVCESPNSRFAEAKVDQAYVAYRKCGQEYTGSTQATGHHTGLRCDSDIVSGIKRILQTDLRINAKCDKPRPREDGNESLVSKERTPTTNLTTQPSMSTIQHISTSYNQQSRVVKNAGVDCHKQRNEPINCSYFQAQNARFCNLRTEKFSVHSDCSCIDVCFIPHIELNNDSMCGWKCSFDIGQQSSLSEITEEHDFDKFNVCSDSCGRFGADVFKSCIFSCSSSSLISPINAVDNYDINTPLCESKNHSDTILGRSSHKWNIDYQKTKRIVWMDEHERDIPLCNPHVDDNSSMPKYLCQPYKLDTNVYLTKRHQDFIEKVDNVPTDCVNMSIKGRSKSGQCEYERETFRALHASNDVQILEFHSSKDSAFSHRIPDRTSQLLSAGDDELPNNNLQSINMRKVEIKHRYQDVGGIMNNQGISENGIHQHEEIEYRPDHHFHPIRTPRTIRSDVNFGAEYRNEMEKFLTGINRNNCRLYCQGEEGSRMSFAPRFQMNRALEKTAQTVGWQTFALEDDIQITDTFIRDMLSIIQSTEDFECKVEINELSTSHSLANHDLDASLNDEQENLKAITTSIRGVAELWHNDPSSKMVNVNKTWDHKLLPTHHVHPSYAFDSCNQDGLFCENIDTLDGTSYSLETVIANRAQDPSADNIEEQMKQQIFPRGYSLFANSPTESH